MIKKFFIERNTFGNDYLIFYPQYLNSQMEDLTGIAKKAMALGLCQFPVPAEGSHYWTWDNDNKHCRLLITDADTGSLETYCETCQKAVTEMCNELNRMAKWFKLLYLGGI